MLFVYVNGLINQLASVKVFLCILFNLSVLFLVVTQMLLTFCALNDYLLTCLLTYRH